MDAPDATRRRKRFRFIAGCILALFNLPVLAWMLIEWLRLRGFGTPPRNTFPFGEDIHLILSQLLWVAGNAVIAIGLLIAWAIPYYQGR